MFPLHDAQITAQTGINPFIRQWKTMTSFFLDISITYMVKIISRVSANGGCCISEQNIQDLVLVFSV